MSTNYYRIEDGKHIGKCFSAGKGELGFTFAMDPVDLYEWLNENVVIGWDNGPHVCDHLGPASRDEEEAYSACEFIYLLSETVERDYSLVGADFS